MVILCPRTFFLFSSLGRDPFLLLSFPPTTYYHAGGASTPTTVCSVSPSEVDQSWGAPERQQKGPESPGVSVFVVSTPVSTCLRSGRATDHGLSHPDTRRRTRPPLTPVGLRPVSVAKAPLAEIVITTCKDRFRVTTLLEPGPSVLPDLTSGQDDDCSTYHPRSTTRRDSAYTTVVATFTDRTMGSGSFPSHYEPVAGGRRRGSRIPLFIRTDKAIVLRSVVGRVSLAKT